MSTFQLPNLQSSLPIGWGNGQGLTPRVIGETGGSDNVTLLTSSVPPHTHAFNATTAFGGVNAPGPTLLAGQLATTDGTFYADPNQTGFTAETMNGSALSMQGGSQPHNNVQPSMGINYLICLSGIFPSRG